MNVLGIGLWGRLSAMSSHAAALLPIVLVAVGFVIFCLVDVWRADDVRYLPRWAWTIVCLISVPLGGIVYLVFGRGAKPA